MQGAAGSHLALCRRPAEARRPARAHRACGLTARSEQEIAEPAQPDRLAAGERLAVADADEMPPVAGPVTDRLDDTGLALGLVVHQLRSVAAQGRDLGIELVGDVDDQAGPLDDP